MEVPGELMVEIGLLFYTGLLELTPYLVFTLILFGYDIRNNLKTTITLSVTIFVLVSITFYLPQAVRSILNYLIVFAGIKWCLGFSTLRSLLASFIFMLLQFINAVILFLPFLYLFDTSPAEFGASPVLRLIFPWSFVFVGSFLIYLSYRKQWRIPDNLNHAGLKAGLMAMPLFQLAMLTIIINENSTNTQIIFNLKNPENYFLLLIVLSTCISFFYIWRILSMNTREAAVTAQEQVAAEMQDRIKQIRAQRHDFINHMQIIAALLREGQLQEIRRYIDNINASRDGS